MARRRRSLTADERDLWRRVAKAWDIKPVEEADSTEILTEAPPPEPAPRRDLFAEMAAPQIGRRSRKAPAVSVSEKPDPAEAHRRPEAPEMDRRKLDKMTRGRLPVEARIDLHGMRQHEAYGALIDFIARSHMRGLRLVLVITGKGQDDPQRSFFEERRGVLRHAVPGWLRQGPIRPYVMEIVTAHRRHGGAGAYYVYLRRPGKTR
ncbi:Smr/MutS family protein [Paracoccaceae bacterium GXU_MW_L88]